MTKYFFLNEKKLHKSKNTLRGNPRIVKFDPSIFWIRNMPEPNPSFPSVMELVQKDKRFKEFKKERPKTASLLMLNENIIDIRDMVIASSTDNAQAGKMLMHLIEGNRTSKQFTGIHHLPDPLPAYIINLRVIEPPDIYGVYRASFQLLDQDGSILEKENISTLFPSNWSKQKLYEECLYALDHKTPFQGSRSFYTSETFSGIPVEMHFDSSGEKIRTLYPIRTVT